MGSAVCYEFAALSAQLAEMCALAGTAMAHATRALLSGDVELAEAVIAGQVDAAAMNASAEEATFLLLASQAGTATDLRVVVNAIRITADAERMGELAVEVAQMARRHHPGPAVPAPVRGCVAELSNVTVELAGAAREVLLAHDLRLAARLRRDDGAVVGELHRRLLTVLVGPDWTSGVAAGVDVALIGRRYQRFADHAVHIAERFALPTNGHQFPEYPVKTAFATRRRA